MKSILITGINGFIGASYARIARKNGFKVIGSDLGPRDLSGRADLYFGADLSAAAPGDLADALPSVDLILHAVGVSGFMVAQDRPQVIVQTNVAGSLAIFELARRVKSRRVVLCSSIMVYGPDREGVTVRTEEEYPTPVSVYGASKLGLEGLMHGFVGQYGLDAVALRFSHVYGPGRTTECFIRDMLRSVIDGRPCAIPQASRSRRQYVYIDDVCRSIDLAFNVEQPRFRVFNVSAGEVHTLADVANAIRAIAGTLNVSFNDAVDIPAYRIGQMAIDRAREVLGYVPKANLAEGLQQYWGELRRSC